MWLIERPLDVRGVAVVPLKTTARIQFRTNWSKGHVSRHALQKSLALAEAAPAGDLVFVAAHHPLIDGGAATRFMNEVVARLERLVGEVSQRRDEEAPRLGVLDDSESLEAFRATLEEVSRADLLGDTYEYLIRHFFQAGLRKR